MTDAAVVPYHQYARVYDQRNKLEVLIRRLNTYSVHFETCKTGDCTCGFDTLIDEIKETLK